MLRKIQYHVKYVIRKSNVLLEVVDARVFLDLINPKIKKICERTNKKHILVINKIDLVPKSYQEYIQKTLKKLNYDFVLVSTKTRKNIGLLKKKIKSVDFDKVFVGVLGVVNVGKSSLINALKFKHSARTSPTPGFTRGYQLIKLSSRVYLLDSPGTILLNKKDFIGDLYSISPKDYKKIAIGIIDLALKSNPKTLQDVYKITFKENSSPEEILEKIGRRLNFLNKNQQIDLNKVYQRIFQDWHKGKIKAWKFYPET